MDGNGRNKHTFNDDFSSPVDSYDSSENKLWQSPNNYAIEDAQLLDIIISNSESKIIYNLTGDVNRNVTDINGKIYIRLTNLESGNYSISASHKCDEYYTDISNTDNFVIYDVNITKTTDKKLAHIGENVTYFITVNNTGNVTLN